MRITHGRAALALVIATIATLVACSGNDLVIRADLLSFLNDSGTRPNPSSEYGVAALPVPVAVSGIEVVEPSSVDVADVVDRLARVNEARIDYRLASIHRQGSGRAVVRIRFAASREELFAATSLIESVELPLVEGQTVEREGSVTLDERALNVLRGDVLWITMDVDLEVDAATTVGDSLAGRIELRQLFTRIRADESFFN